MPTRMITWATPPSAGPDEPFQQATAWYLSGHVLQPDGTPEYSVPASLLVSPCYLNPARPSAACMPAHSREMGSYAMVLNYPPPYFWVVGAGERLAALVGLEYADVGGRLASFHPESRDRFSFSASTCAAETRCGGASCCWYQRRWRSSLASW